MFIDWTLLFKILKWKHANYDSRKWKYLSKKLINIHVK